MYVQPAGFSLQHAYQSNRRKLEDSMARLATGDKMAVPGSVNAGELSVSQRFRHQIRRAQASTQAIQQGLNYLNNSFDYIKTVSDIITRMHEVAAFSSQSTISDTDREAISTEFEALKAELSAISRDTTFNSKQVLGTDVVASYNANDSHMHFYTLGGIESGEIFREFDANATDSQGTKIGFDSSEDFTMSRDGKSLFFLGTVDGDAAGVVRVKRYDINTHTLYEGSDLFATGDKMFVNEDGTLYVNGTSTLYTVDANSLARTATAVTDMEEDTEFSVYKNEVYYYRNSDNRVVKYNFATTTTTNLTGVIAFGSGAHTFSGAGNYIAEESPAGSIRVIDTSNGSEATIAIGGANSVTDLHFDEDGNRVYYVNKVSNAIEYVEVDTDDNDNVVLNGAGTIVQGTNSNSFNGLDLGGANHGATYNFVVAQDEISTLSYGAVDLNLYMLGLAQTQVDTFDNANAAITDLKEASNRVSLRRARIGAAAARLEHVLNINQNFIGTLKNSESQIRDTDLALESTALSTSQVRNQAAMAMLTQYNQISRNVLALLTS